MKTLRLLFAAGLCASAGCGVGGGLVLSLGHGGGGGGPPRKPPPTVSVNVASPASPSNYIDFTYKLVDPQVKPTSGADGSHPKPGETDPRVRIAPQYRIARPPVHGRPQWGPWLDMTPAPVVQNDGTRGLPLGAHVFTWDTIVDLGGAQVTAQARLNAEYEAVENIARKFPNAPVGIAVDNRLAATVVADPIAPRSDVDTFPVDVRPDGDGFLVADLGMNVVERVDSLGKASRIVGVGVPGSFSNDGVNPGVARLPSIFQFDKDPAGNVFTDHGGSLLVTNVGATPLVFGLVDGPDADSAPDTVVVAPHTIATARIPALSQSRAVRRHPSGALLLTNQLTNGDYEIDAVNPQDPTSPSSTSIVLGTATVAPGQTVRLVGGGSASPDGADGPSTRVQTANALAVGPDGEIYFVENALGRVRVLNATPTPLTIGGRVVAAGAVDTVAGGNGLGAAGDGASARAAQLNLPGSIDVDASRTLFVADTGDFLVRMVCLGPSARTFAETTVAPGNIDVAVGGGTGGVASKARAIALTAPNAVAVDSAGNLLVADGHQVLLVDGGTTTVTAYGKTAGPARTAQVYDASARAGLPLLRPRAAHLRSPAAEEVFFTDRSTVRVLDLASSPAVFGAVTADAGGVAVVGGGAAPGFSGDGGPARLATFDAPAALANDGDFALYVADSGNDRVRLVNVGDPLTGGAQSAFGVSVPVGGVDTVIGGAVGPLPADGDGLAPRSCSLSNPQGVAVSSAHLVFVADTGHHRIRCANPGAADVVVAGVTVAAGTIRTIVGGGAPGFTPDGAGPWLVSSPTAVEVDDQLLYFADSGNARIRVLNMSASVVHVAGIDVAPSQVATIVGTGVRGNFGDGGSGPGALVDTPRSLFVVTAAGVRTALVFADEPQHVVRMLNLTDGDLAASLDGKGAVATTVPGDGIVSLAGGPNAAGAANVPEFEGDGEIGARVRFSSPWGVVVTSLNGCLSGTFVMDSGNDRVRRFGAPPVRSCATGP